MAEMKAAAAGPGRGAFLHTAHAPGADSVYAWLILTRKGTIPHRN